VDNLRAGRNEVPEANFGYLGRGIELFMLRLVIGIAIAGVFLVTWVPGIVLMGAANDRSGAGLAVLGALWQVLGFGLIFMLSAGFVLVYPTMALITMRSGFGAALNPSVVLAAVRRNWSHALVAGLIWFAANFIGGLGIYACCIGFIFTYPYSIAVEAGILRALELGPATAPTTG
jgi:hypothetical protein